MPPVAFARSRRRAPFASPGAGLAAVATVLLLAGGCRTDGPTGPADELTELPRALTAAERRTIAAGNEFSVALFREVNARKAGENVFISPFSAAMALGMTLNGAAGATAEEMRATLGLAGRSPQEINESYRDLTELLLSLDRSVDVRIANAVFHRSDFPVEPSFVETSRTWFDAEVTALDFGSPSALAAVNGWASRATNGRIEQVVDRVEPNTVMFLLNALYFKGSWRSQFDPRRTSAQPFRQADGTTATVQMMSQERAPVRVGRTADGAQVAELPYGNGAWAMTIVLPAAGRSVDDEVAALTPARWEALLAGLEEAKVTLELPRFRLSYEDSWNDVLSAMGMPSAFGAGADFSRMGPGLLIDYVKQNAFVEVNEEGTEAAAVTTVAMVDSAPESFRVDRPFLFAIRERLSGTVLFVGKVTRL